MKMRNTLDRKYLDLVADVLDTGISKRNRTGIDTLSISGAMIKHDMSEGFPALTTKRIAYKTMAVELEGFIKGITSKDWYQANNCKIWNEWCNPSIIPKGLSDEERKEFQLRELDLGPIYGSQWRNFNGAGYDQLEMVLHSLENNPSDRRMLVSAWNPLALHEQALPPCHVLWHVIVRGDKLDLIWYQRSVDVFLGLPFNIASYGLLLILLSKQFGYKYGTLTGFLGDTHIYENHIEQIHTQMMRQPYELPVAIIDDNFTDVRQFDYRQFELEGYRHHPSIKGEVAV